MRWNFLSSKVLQGYRLYESHDTLANILFIHGAFRWRIKLPANPYLDRLSTVTVTYCYFFLLWFVKNINNDHDTYIPCVNLQFMTQCGSARYLLKVGMHIVSEKNSKHECSLLKFRRCNDCERNFCRYFELVPSWGDISKSIPTWRKL